MLGLSIGKQCSKTGLGLRKQFRLFAVGRDLRFDDNHRIMPVGRYGTWNYMGMEDSILHGIQAAGFLKGRAAAGG